MQSNKLVVVGAELLHEWRQSEGGQVGRGGGFVQIVQQSGDVSGFLDLVFGLQPFVGIDHEAEPMAGRMAGFDERLVGQADFLEDGRDHLIAFLVFFDDGYRFFCRRGFAY